MKRKYEWAVGQTPPDLDRHSIAKHNVLRDYLQLYVQVLTVNPRRDRLSLTLVDGFCGGGLYSGPGRELRQGSPLIMLESMAAAETLARASRKKEFYLDAEYYFVDEDRSACEHLRHVIGRSQYTNAAAHVINGKFDSHLPTIIDRIQRRGTAHRCIFVLDQYGYKETPLALLRHIFQCLPHAEVILTFATDFLIDYLGSTPSSQQILDGLGFGLSVEDVQHAKSVEPTSWRAAVQQLLHRELFEGSGARHYTPFFIRCPDAHRSYWLVHLSNHHRARDVMTTLHWHHGNDFSHYGGSGLEMLGYDWRRDPEQTGQRLLGDEFRFDEVARESTQESLMCSLPRRLPMGATQSITVDEFFAQTTNETPATKAIMCNVMSNLSRDGEIEVYRQDGKLRGRGVILVGTDRICVPTQRRFFVGGTG